MTGKPDAAQPLEEPGWDGSRRDALQRLRSAALDPIELIGILWGITTVLWNHSPRFIRVPAQVVTQTFLAYSRDNCSIYAAAIAYYAIFSLIPLSLITLSVFGLVVSEDRIVKWVFDQFALQDTERVQEQVVDIVRTARDLSLPSLGIGLAALIWTASGVFSAVRRGLNATSHTQRKHRYLYGKLIDFALVPALGMLIVVSIGLTAASRVVVGRVDQLGPFPMDQTLLLRWSSFGAGVTVSLFTFLVLYRFVPSARPGWKEAWISAVCATVLFEGMKALAAYILGRLPFSQETVLYSGMGTALAFLYLAMLNGSILLFASEFGRMAVGRDEE
jgi:membrane protein